MSVLFNSKITYINSTFHFICKLRIYYYYYVMIDVHLSVSELSTLHLHICNAILNNIIYIYTIRHV